MGYKTQRNIVLRDAYRLISATYHDDLWSAPDGHFAIAYDLYHDYRTKKDQDVPPVHPKLDAIIDTQNEYHLAEFETENSTNQEWVDLDSTACKHNTIINKMYLDLFRSIWPNATPHIVGDNNQSNPVRMYCGKKLVGVIMPVRRA